MPYLWFFTGECGEDTGAERWPLRSTMADTGIVSGNLLEVKSVRAFGQHSPSVIVSLVVVAWQRSGGVVVGISTGVVRPAVASEIPCSVACRHRGTPRGEPHSLIRDDRP